MRNDPSLAENDRSQAYRRRKCEFVSLARLVAVLCLPGVLLFSVLLCPLRIQAGEAIQFSPGKSKVASELDNRLSKEKASAPGRRAPVSELGAGIDNPLVSSPTAARRSRAEEKKAKNAELEKKNWILFNRGELQEKEESAGGLGVRDYDGEGIEKEKTLGELWFTPSREPAKGPSQTSRINMARPAGGPGGVRPNVPATTERAERAPDERATDVDASRLSGKEGRDAQGAAPQAPGSVKDLEMRDGVAADAQEGALKDLFNPRSAQVAP